MPSLRSARKSRANGEGTVYQRKDGRWEAASYVLTTNGTRKRTRVYGATRKEAVDKLTERMAANNRDLPAPAADCAIGVYLQNWLHNIAVHQLRETTHTRYRATARLYINPTEETRQARHHGRPSLPRPTPHPVPVLHPRTRHPRHLLLGRELLRQTALTADRQLRALRPQIRTPVRRPGG